MCVVDTRRTRWIRLFFDTLASVFFFVVVAFMDASYLTTWSLFLHGVAFFGRVFNHLYLGKKWEGRWRRCVFDVTAVIGVAVAGTVVFVLDRNHDDDASSTRCGRLFTYHVGTHFLPLIAYLFVYADDKRTKNDADDDVFKRFYFSRVVALLSTAANVAFAYTGVVDYEKTYRLTKEEAVASVFIFFGVAAVTASMLA